MKMDFQKIRERLGLSSDKPLTPEEKRRRARYIVYPFFCLLCAGFLLLVFSPSEKEKAEKEKGKGFNVEMPSPKDSEMEGDKVSAYEQEALAKKEKWRRGTFQEMSKLLNKDSQDTAGLTAGKANTELPPEPETGKSPGSVHSSAEAYRNMNRSLGAVYTRNENQQNADLLRRIEELEKEKRPAEGQPEGQTLEEKMALLEKSYELAARYNGKQPDAPAAVNGRSDRKDRTAVRPVKQVRNQVVSSLAQPMGNEDFIAEFAGERNTGFHTPIGRTLPSGRNTIAACVHGTQTVSDGQVLRIRLLEPMAVDDRLIPQGMVLTGGTRIQGERMDILVETVEYKGTLFPVELEVYDADGQRGILVPNSMEYDAAREIAAGMVFKVDAHQLLTPSENTQFHRGAHGIIDG